jgi:large subunit ribosomal protein L35
MPKMKTHKGMATRLRVTRTGKVVHRKPNKRHLLSAKSAKRRRNLRRPTTLGGRMAKIITRLMGVK